MKGGMLLSWSPLLQQQLHFWAHWDGSVQLSPCIHMSKSPSTLPCLALCREGHSELTNLEPHVVQWKLLLSVKTQLDGKCWMLCGSHQEAGYRVHSSVSEKDSNHPCSPSKGCVTKGRVSSASPAELVPLCRKVKCSVSRRKVKCSVSHRKWAQFLSKAIGSGRWCLCSFSQSLCMSFARNKYCIKYWCNPCSYAQTHCSKLQHKHLIARLKITVLLSSAMRVLHVKQGIATGVNCEQWAGKAA